MGTAELRRLYRNLRSIWPWTQTLVEADADTAWKRTSDAARRNIAYKLMNVKGGGELQRIYSNDGAEALREHIRWALPKYLYNDGRKAGVITRMEFARYRHRLAKRGLAKTCRVCEEDDNLVNLTHCDECGDPYHINCLNPILSKVLEGLWFCHVCQQDPENLEHTDSLLEEKLANDNTVVDVQDHSACWNLKMRGVVGETPLHICFLSSTENDLAIGKIMLEEFPYLAHDIYEGTTFFGENALHFAIVKRNMESAKLLLQYGASLVARGRGTFFQPYDILNGIKTAGKTNFKGNACYGEYPLAFAASLGMIKMYDYFIKQSKKKPSLGKVDPNAQDSFGNTVLHWCVIHRQRKMYKHAIKHSVLAANPSVTNYAGLTPLSLACRLGHCDMFEAILNYSSKPLWTHGVTCLACPLDCFDSINTDGVKNETSALQIIVKGSKEGHFKMLETSVVARLLHEKWQRYIKRRFVAKFAWTFIHLTLLFTATQLRPENPDHLLGPTDTKSIVRYIIEIGVLIGCTAQFVSEASEMKLLKPKYYLQNLVQVPARMIFCIACILIYVCIIFRFTGRYMLEELTLMIAIPCSWSYIFFFYRGTETLGPYVVMIGKMLTGDILQFWIIMSTFLTLFATVFYFLFLDGSLDVYDESNEGFSLPWRAFISLFGMTFGNFDYTEFYKSRLNWFSTLLFVIFMVISPILLLNMLIAMMAKTYDVVRERAREEWRKQWTRIILVMEGAVPREELIFHQSNYSEDVPLSTWTEPVTSSSSKHRTKSRGTAEIHNPAFEEDNLNKGKPAEVTNGHTQMKYMRNDIAGSKETLVTGTHAQINDASTSPASDLAAERPTTIKALLIMKAIDRHHRKRNKRHSKSKESTGQSKPKNVST